ncbi:MAG TPA: hypothetical protein ACFYEL_04520 [Candidatus Wunengus californicus]|uniref:hypothetical protein n=1 Tax=Candidatus Wunengus californicus TaxID=3367619 RepID=UPI0040251CAE
MYRETLLASGLFLEGTEFFTSGNLVNSYYGYNVSKMDKEPVDQLHGFWAAKRIQEHNLERFGEAGRFSPFIAGVFEVMNATDRNGVKRVIAENTVKERKKKALFQSALDRYGIQGEVLVTEDLLRDERYWAHFAALLEDPRFSEERLTEDTLHFYHGGMDELSKVLGFEELLDEMPKGMVNIPTPLLHRIRNWRSAILYVPAEITESIYLQRERGVNLKIGHADERIYDKYIMGSMDVVHLRQPVNLESSRLEPDVVTPYIEMHRRKNKVRVFFNDTEQGIRERIKALPVEEYDFTIYRDVGGRAKEAGEVLNPFLEKAMFAVESARCLGRTPVDIGGYKVNDGAGVVALYRNGNVSIRDLHTQLPALVAEHITKVFPYG